MITHLEVAALDEGRRRAEANGHRMSRSHEGLALVRLYCLDCPADVALLKGGRLELSGLALFDPCSCFPSIHTEVRCA